MRLTFVIIIASLLCSCGTFPPTPEPVPVPIVEPAPVVTPVEVAMWYTSDGWAFNNPAMPYPTLAVSTKTDWSKGRVTAKIKGIGYDNLIMGKDHFIFVAYLKTPNGNEGNIQLNIADRVPRLISQRFDGTCAKATHGRDFCEHQSHGYINFDVNEVYSFMVEWNESTAHMTIHGEDGSLLMEGSVPTDGSYAGASWIKIGNGVLPPYPPIPTGAVEYAGKTENGIVIINPVLREE